YAPWMDLAAMVSKTMARKAEIMPEFARVPVACLPYGVPMCLDTKLPARDFTGPDRFVCRTNPLRAGAGVVARARCFFAGVRLRGTALEPARGDGRRTRS